MLKTQPRTTLSRMKTGQTVTPNSRDESVTMYSMYPACGPSKDTKTANMTKLAKGFQGRSSQVLTIQITSLHIHRLTTHNKASTSLKHIKHDEVQSNNKCIIQNLPS